MKNHKDLSLHIQEIIQSVTDTVQKMEAIPGFWNEEAEKWLQSCRQIQSHVESNLLKIAVVGAIKSGKSTFINALLHKEVVKRGAGVITSITTRIRKGKKNKATVYLKSWDDINKEIKQAIDCFPREGDGAKDFSDFDLRRKNDRAYLKEVFQTLSIEKSVSENGSIRKERLLIDNVLKGFDFASEVVEADANVLEFSGRQFGWHKDFTADSTKSFFVKDVCLELISSKIDTGIEIADCQGSDSTDPSQILQILNYLETANLIIYLISSRTGVRQADIKFLSTIKRMGLDEHILFVNNCDLSEHDNLKDLQRVDQKIRSELQLFKEKPLLFSFSSLFVLFSNLKSVVPDKDRKRLEYWKDDKKLINYCDRMFDSFVRLYHQLLEKEKFELLAGNHVERLKTISKSSVQQLNLFSDILSKDVENAKETIEKLKQLNQSAKQLEKIVNKSLVNTVKELEQLIDSRLSDFFNPRTGPLIKRFKEFVELYSFNFNQYEKELKSSGINQVIYIMFQDFRSDFDLFTANEIHPLISEFIRSLEESIQSYFEELNHSYDLDFYKNIQLLKLEENEYTREVAEHQSQFGVNMDTIKKILGIAMPDLVFQVKYTGQIKVRAFAGFGLTTLFEFLAKIKNQNKESSHLSSIKSTAQNIKSQNIKTLTTQMETYRKKLNENYIMPLIEAISRDFNDRTTQRFQMFAPHVGDVETIYLENEKQKNIQKETIQSFINNFNEIIDRLERI